MPGGALWEAIGTKGYKYRDSSSVNDGVRSVNLLEGVEGKSRLQLKGKGIGLGIPAAASPTQLFSGSTAVTVQLHGNGNCWETSFGPDQSRNGPNSYQSRF